MDFELTPEQEEIREVARQFAEDELGDKIAPFDERHQFPFEIVNKLAPLGLLGVLVPEEYGGAGLDYVSYALIVEELCRGDASVGITMWAHNSLCSNHIALHASREQKAKYLPRLASGETLGDRKSTRLNSSHSQISYAVFCLKKKKILHSIEG